MNISIIILIFILLNNIICNSSYDLEDLSCIGGTIENYQNNKIYPKSNQLFTSLNTFDWRSLFPKKYSKTTLYAFDGHLKNDDTDIILKTGDIIQCEVIRHDKSDDNINEINVTTTHSNDHTYFMSPKENCFSFRVRAKTAIIGLSGNPIRSNMIIELVLQAGGNSYVRKGSKFEIVTQVNFANIIDEGEYRSFWIKWTTSGIIEIGRGQDILPFLTYKEVNMFPINYVGVHTWEHPGNWVLNFQECPGKNSKQNQFTDTRCIRLPKKDRSSILMTSVRLQKELLVQLEEDHTSFLNSDRHKSSTYLDGTLKELKRNFEHSEDLHNKIFFNDADDEDQQSRERYMKEKIFEKIKNKFYDFMEDLDKESKKIQSAI